MHGRVPWRGKSSTGLRPGAALATLALLALAAIAGLAGAEPVAIVLAALAVPPAVLTLVATVHWLRAQWLGPESNGGGPG
jgi:hypothetical protein